MLALALSLQYFWFIHGLICNVIFRKPIQEGDPNPTSFKLFMSSPFL